MTKVAALLAIARLVSAPAKVLRAVRQAFADPVAAVDAADFGDMDPQDRMLPWLVLLDALERAKRIASVDWKEAADEIMASLDKVSTKDRTRWAWTRSLDLNAIATRAFLERAGSELVGETLLSLDAETDAYQLVLVPPARAHRLASLARTAGYARHVEILRTRRSRPKEAPRAKRRVTKPRTQAQMWTRLEYVAGTSKKFWTIRPYGKALHTAWGRIGTSGQDKWIYIASPKLCAETAGKLIAAKLRAGYRRVTTYR